VRTHHPQETVVFESLADAARRLLKQMDENARHTRRPLAENARPFLRLVAANENERRDHRGEDTMAPQCSVVSREDRDGIFVSDADGE
jgi:hypothetical protein